MKQHICTHITKWLKSKKKGFTLVEMLIVLIVVALLMAIIIPNISGQRKNINERADENIVQVVKTQAETYRMSENQEPGTIDELGDKGYLTPKQVEAAKDYEKRTNNKVLD